MRRRVGILATSEEEYKEILRDQDKEEEEYENAHTLTNIKEDPHESRENSHSTFQNHPHQNLGEENDDDLDDMENYRNQRRRRRRFQLDDEEEEENENNGPDDKTPNINADLHQLNDDNNDDEDNNEEDEDLEFYRRRRKLNLKKYLKSESDSDSEEYNQLSACSNYSIKKCLPTQKELEIDDEKKIEASIHSLNESFARRKNKKENDKDFSDDSSTNSGNLNNVKNKSNQNGNENLNNLTPDSNCVEENNIKSINFSNENRNDLMNFYSQNVKNYDNKIKIILIGKAMVGKSLFINKILGQNFACNNEYDKSIYNPTKSLDIKKTHFNLDELNILVELIDTNDFIINNNIIKTYYQICNGYVIMTNNIIEDLAYLQKQISKINSTAEDPNILLIINEKEINNTNNYSNRDLIENNKEVKDFLSKNYIKFILVENLLECENICNDAIYKSFVRKIIKKNFKKNSSSSTNSIKDKNEFIDNEN